MYVHDKFYKVPQLNVLASGHTNKYSTSAKNIEAKYSSLFSGHNDIEKSFITLTPGNNFKTFLFVTDFAP